MQRVFLVVVAVFMLVPAAAVAELSTFDGDMRFPTIGGVNDPEDFSWEVELAAGQELLLVDETHAEVFYESGHEAFGIEAEPAHDAIGTDVPTTLSVTQPNIVTLTVHHRDATFNYPVFAGAGWEGGFQSVEIEGPPDESQVASPPIRQILDPPPTCSVPDLSGRTLRASRKILHAAHCRLGRVRGERSRAVHVVEQYRAAGRVLPAWSRVDVKALRAAQYSRSS